MDAPYGCSERKTLLEATYLRIHYSADPAKDAAWVKKERAKSPDREWNREMEMMEDVYDGLPVFPEYVDHIHCPLDNRPLEIIPKSIYIGGWDAGQTLNPAFVLLQITPEPYQVQAILEVIPPGPEPMEKFAPRVMMALAKRLPTIWDEVEHWGDTTIGTRNGSTGETAQMVAKRHGIQIKLGSNEWSERYGAVTWALHDMIDDETPRFVIDGFNCPTLREGFKGRYRFEESSKSEGSGAGRIHAMPLKNSYSHIQDANQYGCSRVMKLFKSKQQEKRKFL